MYCEYIRCPFFVGKTWRNKNNGITITCETIRNDMGFDVKNKLSFKNVDERKDWLDIFCTDMDNFSNCPYYIQIYKKYEEE